MSRDRRCIRRAPRLRLLFESRQPPSLEPRVVPHRARCGAQRASAAFAPARDRWSDERSGRGDHRVPSSRNQHDCPERTAWSGIQDRSRRTVYGVTNLRALRPIPAFRWDAFVTRCDFKCLVPDQHLQLVHRGLRHRRPEGRQSAARSTIGLAEFSRIETLRSQSVCAKSALVQNLHTCGLEMR